MVFDMKYLINVILVIDALQSFDVVRSYDLNE